jgi:hypothetical protein
MKPHRRVFIERLHACPQEMADPGTISAVLAKLEHLEPARLTFSRLDGSCPVVAYCLPILDEKKPKPNPHSEIFRSASLAVP